MFHNAWKRTQLHCKYIEGEQTPAEPENTLKMIYGGWYFILTTG